MNNKFLKVILFFILIFSASTGCIYAQNGNLFLSLNLFRFESEPANKQQIIQDKDFVLIKIKSAWPDSLEEQRSVAFKLLRPYFKKSLINASVLWQQDEFSYGKLASVSRVYITDYLDNKITGEKLTGYFNLETIEPVAVRRNNISKITLSEVDDINVKESARLREKADIYRLNGKTDSALRIYNDAIELNQNDYISLYWIAEIYRLDQKYDLAEKYYIKALSIEPDFRAADNALFNLRNSQEE